MLTPARVQELKDRVEIGFSPANPADFAPKDDVVLTATLKNVKELSVKLYEINALNFYLDQGEEINTDINLDGLVANEETLRRYDDPPILRRTEVFAFDSLKDRKGIWVVELIGNGISSRALIRKGKLQHFSATTVGGELVAVLDSENNPVKSASAWFGGREYKPDEAGLVLLPFSEAGNAPVILTD